MRDATQAIEAAQNEQQEILFHALLQRHSAPDSAAKGASGRHSQPVLLRDVANWVTLTLGSCARDLARQECCPDLQIAIDAAMRALVETVPADQLDSSNHEVRCFALCVP